MSSSHSKYQRRHYAQIAGILADLRADALDSGDLFMLETVDVFQSRLATVFTRDNPRFSSDRFRMACETSDRPSQPIKSMQKVKTSCV